MRADATGRFAAYSPQTNVMYVELQNLCADYRVRADNIPSKPSDQYNTIGPQVLSAGATNIGRLDAISVETGKTLWSWETPASNYSPVLATAGGMSVQRLDGPLSAGFRPERRQGAVADAAGIAGVRRDR